MGKYLVKDLKKVKQNEILNLKGDTTVCSKQPTPTPKSSLDLSSLHRRTTHFTKSGFQRSKTRNLENITSSQPRPTFSYIPVSKITPPTRFAHFFSSLRFAALGLLIVFSLNILNVFQNGYTLGSNLIGNASSGFGNILEGASSAQKKNFSSAQNSFAQAEQSFNQALEKISFLNASQNQVLATEKNSSSVSHLLLAGQSLSQAGNLFSQAANDFQNIPSLFLQANRDFLLKKTQTPTSSDPSTTATTSPTLTDSLKIDLDKVDQAITHLKTAQTELDQVDAALIPAKYRDQLPALRDKLAKLNQFLSQMRENFPAILKLLGDRYPHRYAVLLQNDTESRPTGGFIGSLLIFDINEGIISRFDFHDVYQYDGQLLEKITPPEEISKITDSWYLRDSNYSPDFALSAEKAAWFLQKSKGPSVDTVIAVNQSFISDLLKITGPLQVPELKSTLDADNFQFILGYLIESKFYGKTQPKIILEKTIKAFQQKILSLSNWGDLIGLITKEISTHRLMFYSRDQQVQSFFEYLHLTPHQLKLSEKEDYLQVIASSVGGNKSDAFMSQELNHQTFLDPDGTIHDELTIKRKHNWSEADFKRWQSWLDKFSFKEFPDYLVDILGRGENKASIKVYLPLGTELEKVTGQESSSVSLRSDAELQKSYLLLNLNTAAGQESSVTLRYRLPYKLKFAAADIYRLSAQGQIGLVPTTLTHQTNLPPQLTILKSTEAGDHVNLQTDFHFSEVISQ